MWLFITIAFLGAIWYNATMTNFEQPPVPDEKEFAEEAVLNDEETLGKAREFKKDHPEDPRTVAEIGADMISQKVEVVNEDEGN